MKTKYSILVCLLVIQFAAKAQMKVGDSVTTINPASLLELQSTNKGFVFPKVSIGSTSASSPLPTGLLVGTVVYNTNATVTGGNGTGLYVWDGSVWMSLASGTSVNSLAWSLVGNAGLSSSTNFIGTTDAIDFVTRTNNIERMRILGANNGSSKAGWIGMGVTIPRSSLDVTGDYTNKNVITIQNISTTGFSSIDMLDNTGALKGTFGYANTAVGGNFGGRTYFNSYGSDMLFTANSANVNFLLRGTNGYIGINTATPTERLHVVGNFYLNGAFMPGGLPGTTGYVLTSAGANVSPVWTSASSFAWSLTGNAGTNSAINFLGTTDNHPLRFKVNNILAGFVDSTGGGGNAFFGDSAGISNTTGLRNTAIGHQALSFNTTTNNNVAIGFQSLYNNIGTGNTAAGYSSLSTNTTGQYNAAYGFYAMKNNTTGSYNVAVGQSALQNNTTGANNAVVGEDGMLSNTTGRYLAGLGTNALYSNTTGNYSVAVGESTLYNNTTGAANIAIGSYSLFSNTTSNNNIAIGYYAGNLNTTGANNLFIGYQSGQFNTTGSNNTLLGNNTSLLSAGLTNAAAIGYNAKVGANNSLVLGDTASAATAVNVGIGVRSPVKRLHIDAATIGFPSQNDSLKIDHLASSFTSANKGVLVIDSATGYVTRQSLNTLALGNYWSLTGNSGTNYATNFLGTTDNTSLRFRTNNTEQMVVDSIGRVGIGSTSFNAVNPAKLLVDYGNTTSNTIVNLKGSIDDYFQINLQNKSATANASSDYVATADDGTDSTNYIDMGINSSNYAASADNFGGPHDGYLYTNSKNLLIGTAALNSDVVFLLGGGRQRNVIMRLNASDYSVVIGKGDGTAGPLGTTLRGPSALVSAANTAGSYLNVSGGASTGTATGGALNLTGGATSGAGIGGSINITGGTTTGGIGGAVNINTGSANATNINTGTSASNITLGGGANNIILPKFSAVGGLYYTSVNTGQLSTTGANMTWDSINNRLGIGTTAPGYKLSVLSASNPLYLSGVQATSSFNTDSILTINGGVVKKTPYSSLSGDGNWSLTGNAGTNSNNNFIGTTDANDFVTRTNNTERLRVTSAGLVGIGTTNPQQALSIGNGMNIDQNDANTGTATNALTFGYTSGEGIGSKRTTGGNRFGLDFYTGNVNRMVITNGGFVGIGTTAPSNLLSVSGTNPLYLSGLQATTTFSADSILTVNGGVVKKTPYSSLASSGNWSITGNAGTIAGTNFLGTTDATDVVFKTNNVERMRIVNGVSSTTGTAGDITIGDANSGTVRSNKEIVMREDGDVYGPATLRLRNRNNENGAIFETIGASAALVDFLFKTGTAASPLVSNIRFETRALGAGIFISGNSTEWQIGQPANPTFIVSAASTGNSALRIGNLGIGNVNPTEKLDVTGNMKFSGALMPNNIPGTTGYILASAGAGTAPVWTDPAVITSASAWQLDGNALAAIKKFGTTTNFDIPFITNNVERMRLTAGGLLGIGVTNPQQALSVGSGITIDQNNTNTGTAANALIFGNGSGEAIGSKRSAGGNQNGLDFYTSYNNRMVITNGGFVGIGTTAPSNALSVIASNPMYLSGLTALTSFASTDSVLTISAGVVKKIPSSALAGGVSSGWSLTGNSIASGQFLGTTNALPLVLKSNNAQIGLFDGNLGSIALGAGAVNNISDHNIAIGYNASTNNQYTLALGYSATASGVRSVAIGNGATATTASGSEAVAIGFNATATADQTVALGYQTRASGQYGVAIGYNPTASGLQSIAIGYQAQATQQYSNAIGYQAQATGLQSTAIGYQAQTAQANTILLGNASSGNLYVGIGTATPTAKLHIVGGTTTNYPLQMTGLPTGTAGTDNILTINSSGVVGSVTAANFNSTYWGLNGNAAASGNFLGTTNTTPLLFKFNGTNAGYLDANNTSFGTSATSTSGTLNTAIGNSANAANNATAIGASAVASAQNNTAVGNSATANNSTQETALGSSAQATAQYNTAVGYNAQAISNSQATAIGTASQANAILATAVGYGARAISNGQTTAIGSNSQANAQYNTAVGYNAQSTNNSFGTALGTNSSTTGQYATAIGAEADALFQYSTAVGYNAQATTNNQTTAIGSNTSATGTNSTAIGYGATTSQANAIVIGTATNNVGIGTSTPNTSTRLDVSGSFKLGTAGSVLTNVIKGNVGVPSFAIGSGVSATVTVIVAGANPNASVIVNPRSILPNGVVIAYSYVSVANVVTINFASGFYSGNVGPVTLDITLIQ